jgi:2-polyprenyl-3-methyl-5-hydroxy-6-metoxy-1,4-benzoquinol methylase
MAQCCLCGDLLGRLVARKDAKSKADLIIQMCESCGLVQQRDIPSDHELRSYYSHHYRSDYKKTHVPKLKYIYRAGRAAKHRLDFLCQAQGLSFPPGAKWLDIGAGGGEVVYAARQRGFDAQGLEPNEGYSDFARQHYDVVVRTSHLDQIQGEKYDIVSLFHVLEHMPSPMVAFDKLASLMNESGTLIIEVPNIEQSDASPANIFFKAHLFYFSAATLIACASRHFEPVVISKTGNLTVIFKKRSGESAVVLPEKRDLEALIERLNRKGWIEYLTVGGGWRKPLNRLGKLVLESRLSNRSPKEVLNIALSS